MREQARAFLIRATAVAVGLPILMMLSGARPGAAAELRVMFLGDDGHHHPRARFEQIAPIFSERGIELVYTDAISDLNAKALAPFDALLLYANIDEIEPQQEQALLDYVASGHGFVPIHCASFCFRNSQAMIELMGAQFQRHGTGTFRTEPAVPEHPILRGYAGFQSWDETYVRHRHNERDRTVLEHRAEGQQREPWSWVRTHGKGRVFYTAWGHDERTWGNPGFQNLLERGIRWAAGDDPAQAGPFVGDRPFPVPQMTEIPSDVHPFEYLDVGAKIPNYVPSTAWGKQDAPKSSMQKPLSAAESLKHLVTPVGFQVELYASEPDLGGKPIAMNWDERGRLFVCETYDYPNELQPPGKGRDRIRICEDTNGDGRADKFSIFAENLSIPTALVPYRGGWIVQNGSETLFLKDVDGDDRAELRQILIENWNTQDTHGGVSNFRYGLDNWIWAMQGYNQSTPSIDGREQQAFRMGFFRFRLDESDPPRVVELEFLRSTDNNTWGLGLSEEGLVFGSTANHNPSVFMPIPNRYYERVRGWTKSSQLGSIADTHLFKPITDKVRQVDHFGGYTAGAGHALYTARRYPAEYWNRTAFVNGPTGHLTGTFVLTPEGSDFRATSPFNLLASDDEWTAPIVSEVGPDGNVWTIDWYNYIVQHNPTPHGFKTGKGGAYETDLRDKKHGRIYRVTYGENAAKATTTLGDASQELLLETLKHSNMLWRLQAQRLLIERGEAAVLPQLVEMTSDKAVDEIGLNVGAIHALWTMHGLGLLDGAHREATDAALAALRHRSPGVRRNAILVLPHHEDSVRALVEGGLASDRDAQVRLAALLRLADLPPTPQAGPLIVDVLRQSQNANDKWLPDAATCAAVNNSEAFLAAVCDQEETPPALTAMATIVASHFARGTPDDGIKALGEQLVRAQPEMAGSIVRGLAEGWPKDRPLAKSEGVTELVTQLLSHLPASDRPLLLQLAQRWGCDSVDELLASVRQDLLDRLEQTDLTAPDRLAAAQELVAIDPARAESVMAILEQLTPQSPPELAQGLLRALAASESSKLGTLLIERFGQMTPSARAAAISVLLARPASTKTLIKAVGDGVILWSELSLDQRQMLADHPDVLVKTMARAALQRGGALPNADREQVIAELLPIVTQQGDATAGKVAFKKYCAKCHKHSGEGEQIGPDLTGMAIHPKHELLTQILDPSRNVEGNFQTYTVATSDGRVRTGIVTAESQTTIELLDAEAKRETLLREDIDELARSTRSLMPEGFEKQATSEELRDLLEFLTQRGRYLPLDLSKVATISSARGMFHSKDAQVERLIFDDWSPRVFQGIPFQLVDPQEGQTPNVILLHSPNGAVCQTMPRSVALPCRGPAKAIHMLSGVSGWGFLGGGEPTISLIIRLHFEDGSEEDHPLRNGEHFADYIRRVDVPGSEFAYLLRDQQIRYLNITPKRTSSLVEIEFIKGEDATAPIVMAVTVEGFDAAENRPTASGP